MTNTLLELHELGHGLTAIATLGMKTRLKELVAVGVKPVLLMIGETVVLAGRVIAYLIWTR